METTTEVAQPAPPPPHTVRIKRKRNQDPLQALGMLNATSLVGDC